MAKRSKVKIKLNKAGVKKLLRSPEAVEDLRKRARRISNAAGEGMEFEAKALRNRAHATVWTATQEARKAEAEGRDLTRALDAGR